MWPFSGHYRPTEENFMEFCSFLEDHQVDLTNVKVIKIISLLLIIRDVRNYESTEISVH